ncbi:MAG: hypothetical protein IJP28_02740 [Erysipelotrichales bacterium]|nr:hypothetical protein [Erysipelotrichales bacterium]
MTSNKKSIPFTKRITEFQRICDHKGIFARTPFLSLDEQEELSASSTHYEVIADGGFQNAERKQMILLPQGYMGEYSFAITILRSKYSSNFSKLTHRDVLGALMGLGIEREVVGDILIEEDHISIAVSDSIAPYIKDQLTQIGRAGVSFEEYEGELSIQANIKYSQATVSSMRLDKLCATLAHLSRGDAQQMIQVGNIAVNGKVITDTSYIVECGKRISIRHYGKYVIEEILGTTKKENYVIRYGKYI